MGQAKIDFTQAPPTPPS